jgi:murein DD-endopeptidase MepM/ murein hydrolase activator NlpD
VNEADKNNTNEISQINSGTQPSQAGRLRLNFLWRSPWTQGLAIYGLLVLLGLSRTNSEPISFGAGKAEAPEKKLVQITTRRDGDVTRFFVQNLERAEVTVTFNFELENLKCSKALPLTATFPAQKTTEVFALSPINPDEPWQYGFTNFHNVGSAEAVHDDSHCYNLPYAPGRSYRVSQGYDGEFSHHGSNKYAIDWELPDGTPVHAARGGLVVKVKDDSNRGGRDIKYDRYNNYVLIRHSDGTLGQYCHLKKRGVVVNEGDVVNDGDLIAHSGNTGFSSGPHLHFSVYKMKDGKMRESIPVKFRTSSAEAVTLEAGQDYTAPRPALVKQRENERVATGG